uniref:Leu-contryphan-P n=1 Tax=Conus purpurascens TaxID=41690 RepID=COWL_CONPU|nr:RecName: Full=Leu-contryphan-P [Conus purpurascens]
GCVLLPWC